MKDYGQSIEEYLTQIGADGYLIEADSSEADQYYLSGFDAPDPFISLYTPDQLHLLVPNMEASRAKKESPADSITANEEYGASGRIRHFGTKKNRQVLSSFLYDKGAKKIVVSDQFPVGTADGLRAEGIELYIDNEDILTDVRSIKTQEEVDSVREAQKASEKALAAAENLLRNANVMERTLLYDGEPLTSERVRTEIEVTLLRSGFASGSFKPVVACGSDAADPHLRGKGPLSANETIIVDIFPQSNETKYHGDITRTFVVGEPDTDIRRRYNIVCQAQQAALDAIEPGVSGKKVHAAACEVFEEYDFPTVRTNPKNDRGYIHRTGHGVGLEVHENPRLSETGGTLLPGHTVTVEPGLYHPDMGGIRIEDLVVVTDDGYENLTEYEKRLVI